MENIRPFLLQEGLHLGAGGGGSQGQHLVFVPVGQIQGWVVARFGAKVSKAKLVAPPSQGRCDFTAVGDIAAKRR